MQAKAGHSAYGKEIGTIGLDSNKLGLQSARTGVVRLGYMQAKPGYAAQTVAPIFSHMQNGEAWHACILRPLLCITDTF